MESIRKLLSYLPQNWEQLPEQEENDDDPERPTEALASIVPALSTRGYDMHKVIREIVDKGDFFEVKPEFAKRDHSRFCAPRRSVSWDRSQPANGEGRLYDRRQLRQAGQIHPFL